MLKYIDTDIVFQELPDEVTLAVNLSGCPCRCPGCHSSHLWGDAGCELTDEALDSLIEQQRQDITAVSFMGGDAAPRDSGRARQSLFLLMMRRMRRNRLMMSRYSEADRSMALSTVRAQVFARAQS